MNIVEVEANTRLLGPAALNEVMVYNGSIYGVSSSKGPEEVLKKGTSTGVSYIGAFANLAARNIEEAAREGRKEVQTKVKGVKLPSDINIRVNDIVVRFINSGNNRIDIRGPVFTTVVAELS